MAEYITNAVQEVPVNGTVYYNTTAAKGNCHIIHRAGSGNVTLKGGSNTSCHSTFKVSFELSVILVEYWCFLPLSICLTFAFKMFDK